jgi:hypothetical protein
MAAQARKKLFKERMRIIGRVKGKTWMMGEERRR